jgi:hypothetical protein
VSPDFTSLWKFLKANMQTVKAMETGVIVPLGTWRRGATEGCTVSTGAWGGACGPCEACEECFVCRLSGLGRSQTASSVHILLDTRLSPSAAVSAQHVGQPRVCTRGARRSLLPLCAPKLV